MMRYIIKKHYEATSSNPNFKGAVKDYFSGTKGHSIGRENEYPTAWEISEWGYKTFPAAKRGLKAAQELCDWENAKGFWKVSVTLLRVEV